MIKSISTPQFLEELLVCSQPATVTRLRRLRPQRR
jgi:hypothetical protein